MLLLFNSGAFLRPGRGPVEEHILPQIVPLIQTRFGNEDGERVAAATKGLTLTLRWLRGGGGGLVGLTPP